MEFIKYFGLSRGTVFVQLAFWSFTDWAGVHWKSSRAYGHEPPWGRVKKFLAFYGTRRFIIAFTSALLWNTKVHHRIHKRPFMEHEGLSSHSQAPDSCPYPELRRTAVPTLSQSNPTHASLSHFSKVYFNIIIPPASSHLRYWYFVCNIFLAALYFTFPY